jgi:hypothetical protein
VQNGKCALCGCRLLPHIQGRKNTSLKTPRHQGKITQEAPRPQKCARPRRDTNGLTGMNYLEKDWPRRRDADVYVRPPSLYMLYAGDVLPRRLKKLLGSWIALTKLSCNFDRDVSCRLARSEPPRNQYPFAQTRNDANKNVGGQAEIDSGTPLFSETCVLISSDVSHKGVALAVELTLKHHLSEYIRLHVARPDASSILIET